MRDIETRDELENLFIDCYGVANVNSVRNQVGQLWAFVRRIQPGDLVVLPRKASRTIAIGRVTGDYKYRPELPPHAHQARPVEWLVRDLPRDALDQQVLNSLGAFLTVCKIDRDGADKRIRRAVAEYLTGPETILPYEGEQPA
jgi:restriction system protein